MKKITERIFQKKKMSYITDYVKLMRPRHYIKNMLILVPVFFNLELFNSKTFFTGVAGVVIFSLLASVVYIINDINDAESDRKHEKKKSRPIASGRVPVKNAVIVAVALVLLAVWLGVLIPRHSWSCWGLLFGYFVLNIIYSLRWKHVPLLDVVVLVSGFLIRILYGCAISGIPVSYWLCMTVIAVSFYLGLGKRRNELMINGNRKAGEIRGVLRFYNEEFLDKNMYVCMGLAIMFYALWCGAQETIERIGSTRQMWTVPLVILLAMKYSLDIEGGEYADPVEVICGDKTIMFLGIVYVCSMFLILYG